MAFADVRLEEFQEPGARFKVQGLLALLPDDDREALEQLMADPCVPVSKLTRLIHSEASAYPNINPKWFDISRTSISAHCRKLRGE